MGQVFISYRHVEPDESLARALAAALEGRRHPVFLDTQIEIGTRWVAEIDRQIRASAYFVVVLSQDSIRSDMVRQEVALAHQLEVKGEMRILPIRAGFDGELPYDLGSYLNPIQYARWLPGEPFDQICEQVVAAIEKDAALPLKTPESDDPSVLDMTAGVAPDSGLAPLPAADPRVVMETGTVRLSSPFYVARRADERMELALSRPEGATLVVKGARQSGKSSLLARAHALMRSRGQRTVYLDFQCLDDRHLENLGSLLRNLAARIARQLRAEVKPSEVWDEDLGDKDSFADFLETAVLNVSEDPVLLCLDEVDRLFERPYRADFFAAVRGWHNNRALEPTWDRLHLAIAHATDPTLWIDDLNQSPFNVGERLRLDDFTAAETLDLAARHGPILSDMETVDGVRRLVGGQPYLTRQALYVLATQGRSLAELRRAAGSTAPAASLAPAGPADGQLRRHPDDPPLRAGRAAHRRRPRRAPRGVATASGARVRRRDEHRAAPLIGCRTDLRLGGWRGYRAAVHPHPGPLPQGRGGRNGLSASDLRSGVGL